ncbi:MAG: hypothetical protein IJD75_00100, partial [Clostridia bacterium]|nr:hypothetical protein [Clostridia bacterium]
MAKIKPKKAYVKEISDGFSGIGKASANNIRTADIRNFRILPDGSLEKRCGWRTERTLPDTLRAYWSGTLNGISHSFAACGDKVFLLYEKGRFPVATISDTNETVQFFFHHGYLYLLDGEQIYVYNVEEELFEAANGYTPLYGYNWHPKELGEVNEPLN